MTYVMVHLANIDFEAKFEDGLKTVPCRSTEFTIKSVYGFAHFRVLRWPRSTKIQVSKNYADKLNEADVKADNFSRMAITVSRTSEYKKMAAAAAKAGTRVIYAPVKTEDDFGKMYPGLISEIGRDPTASEVLRTIMGLEEAPDEDPGIDWDLVEGAPSTPAWASSEPSWSASATKTSSKPVIKTRDEYQAKFVAAKNEAMFETDQEWGIF